MARITRDDLLSALPDLTRPVASSALRSGAVVVRDRWSIPHIKADNEYDLFFAQGYATAQDRLWQMDFDRLRGLGRSAEYLGPSGLTADRVLRLRNLARAAKDDLALCGDAARLAIEAYSDGVNAFLDAGEPLPVEYRLLQSAPARWEPWHCILLYKIRNAAEGSFQAKLWLCELAAKRGAEAVALISPGYPPGHLLTVPPGERYAGPVLDAVDELAASVEATAPLRETDGGSNGWVISGERSATGKPIVAGDSHRLLEVPNVYYQTHLAGPDFAATGFAIPGMPLVMHFMHNEHVAFGMTHGGVDTQDLFVEQLRAAGDGGVEYRFRDEWRAAGVEHETLSARGGEQASVVRITTHHGTIVAGGVANGYGIALADPGAGEATRWVDAAYGAMKARSADAFEKAMAHWTDRVNNYPYADVAGAFGYALRGRIAKRGAENGWGPVPGWTGEHEWQGVIPAAELPRTRDPETGWAVTCNQRVVDDRYPYYLSHAFGPDYRARRIATRLEEAAAAGRKLDVDDMGEIHADTVSVTAPVIIEAIQSLAPASPLASRALALLRAWDHAMARDSVPALIWASLNREIGRGLARYHYGIDDFEGARPGGPGAVDHLRRQLRPAFIAMVERGDTHLLPAGETLADFLGAAFERAVDALERRLGPDPERWQWGELHRVALAHPLSAVFPDAADLLNPPVVGIAGDADVPWASSFWPLGEFDVGVAPINRYIHDPSDWTRSRWVVPLGSSGHPGSEHFADQLPLWAAVDTVAQLWDWRDVLAEAKTTQVFSP